MTNFDTSSDISDDDCEDLPYADLNALEDSLNEMEEIPVTKKGEEIDARNMRDEEIRQVTRECIVL